MAATRNSDPIALSVRGRRLLLSAFLLLGVALAVHVTHAIFHFGGATVDNLVKNWLYDGMLLGSAAACVARAVLIPADRRAWAILGAGLIMWASGDISWSFLYESSGSAGPTISDAGWLAFYPAAYVALCMLIHSRLPRGRHSLWLDGAIGALATAAVGTALVMPTLTGGSAGASTAAVVTNLAYPILDLVLLGLVVIAFALTGWRPDRVWLLLGIGLAASAVADSWYLYLVAAGGYREGSLVDSLWPAATILMGLAAWQPALRAPPVRADGRRMLLLPTAFALGAIGIETLDHFRRVPDSSIVLASAALLGILVRLRLTFRENLRMLQRSRVEAMTDPLTGLGNRRQLMVDLEEALTDRSPRILVLFDLDGFKNYNDSFGHPAGDSLLNRLGGNLTKAVADNGVVYRIGGDEFCALIHASASREGSLVEEANRALTEHGQGFVVGSSYGAVVLPLEAGSSSEALQIADRRLYRQKSANQRSPRMQTRDVLLRILEERQPRALDDMRQVVRLTVAIGHRLGLSYEQLDELTRAAELADIGKMAVPDAILGKRGPLTEQEWAFVQRHTVIGEAILSAAPALAPVARLVRSSHERFDGRGYPDGLAGETIPLGSRVLAVCDAFDAMTKDRPHAASRTGAEALAEIARCSGSQFDPRVVDTLGAVVRDGDSATEDALALQPVGIVPEATGSPTGEAAPLRLG